jgi:hypothetical protein
VKSGRYKKATWIAAQIETNMLTRAIKDLEISTDRFAAQIPTLEDKVKHYNTLIFREI